MPRHDYSSTCGYADEAYVPIHESPPASRPCPECDGMLRRRFTAPAIRRGFVAHYNHSVGAWVTSPTDFRDHLKRGSEEQMRRLPGTVVDYQPRDPQDLPHTEEGLDATRKARRDAGIDQPKRTIVT